jgi:hypothetical protein
MKIMEANEKCGGKFLCFEINLEKTGKQYNYNLFINNILATTIMLCKANTKKGNTLIIAPKTLLSTWKNEIYK